MLDADPAAAVIIGEILSALPITEPTLIEKVVDQHPPTVIVELGFGKSTKSLLEAVPTAAVYSFDWKPDPDLLTELTFAYPNLRVFVTDHKRIAGYDGLLPAKVDLLSIDGGDSFAVNSVAVEFLRWRFHDRTLISVARPDANRDLLDWLVAAGWTVTGQDDTSAVLSQS